MPKLSWYLCAGSLLIAAPSGGCGGATAPNLGNGDAGAMDALVAEDAPAQTLDCQPGAPTAGAQPRLDVKDTLRGTNGVFVDACDDQGNLTDFTCETGRTCGPGPNPECTSFATGKVVPQSFDCSGHCVDGRCDDRCPTQGQRFSFVGSAAGAITVHNDADGRTYVCTVIFQNPHSGFDCASGPRAGPSGTISSLGLRGTPCTGKDFGNIGVTVDGQPTPTNENCAYACSIP